MIRISLACGILLLAGCVKYSPTKFHQVPAQFTSQSGPLKVHVKKLTPNNSSLFTKSKVFKTYIPLEISIENKSNEDYRITRNNISIAVENPKEVAKKFHKNPLLAFIWPLALIDNQIKLHFCALSVILLLNSYGGAQFILLSPMLTSLKLSTEEDNAKITSKFYKYATNFTRPLFLIKKSITTKIIYVPEEFFKQKFYIKAINNIDEKSIMFNVNLGNHIA